MITKSHVVIGGKTLAWTLLLGLSGLLAHNALLYFYHGEFYGILPEKTLARQSMIWNVAFYAHLPAGIVCLFIPALLFQRMIFKPGGVLHRHLGRVYTFTTMYIVCPTGVYLGLYAKGGLATQSGFVLQGLLLGIFTWSAYHGLHRGDLQHHMNFAIRSYATAAVVITFRLLHIIFFLLDLPYRENYALSQWLGLSINILIAELTIITHQRSLFNNEITMNAKHQKS